MQMNENDITFSQGRKIIGHKRTFLVNEEYPVKVMAWGVW